MAIKAIHDVMYSKAPLTIKQRQAIAEVHEAALAYHVLDMSQRAGFRFEIRKQINGRQRWLATRHTPPEHNAFRPLMTLLDDLIADQGVIKTVKGWFTEDELKAAEVSYEREDGRTLIVFPYLYPWKSKPEGNGTGVRDEARYRLPSERRPFLSTFSQAGPRTGHSSSNTGPDWWNEEDEDGAS